jgi:hypothetical protein
MAYNETECSDPWSVAISTNETELLKEIETYFKTTYEISFIDVATKLEDLKLKCFSCDCPTGRKFFVRVDEAFVEILQDENFYLE